MVGRRNFLKVCAATSVATALPGCLSAEGPGVSAESLLFTADGGRTGWTHNGMGYALFSNQNRVEVDDMEFGAFEIGADQALPSDALGSLSYPVAVESVGASFVVLELQNARLQFFDPRGRPERTLGSYGTGDAELRAPRDLALASDGSLLIADSLNHRVQILSPAGEFVGSFGEGVLNGARSLAVDQSGYVHVASSERVEIFDSRGNHHGSYAEGSPRSLCAHPDGSIWVADAIGLSLTQYSAVGDMRERFELESPPMHIAVALSGTLHVNLQSGSATT